MSPASSAKVRMTDRRSAPVKSKLTGNPEYLLLASRLRHHLSHRGCGGLDGSRSRGRCRRIRLLRLHLRRLGAGRLGRRRRRPWRLRPGRRRLLFRCSLGGRRRRGLGSAFGWCRGLGGWDRRLGRRRSCRRGNRARRGRRGLADQQHQCIAVVLDAVRDTLGQVDHHSSHQRLLREGGDPNLLDWSFPDGQEGRNRRPDIREVEHQARRRVLDRRHRARDQLAVAGQRDPHAVSFRGGLDHRQRGCSLGRGRLLRDLWRCRRRHRRGGLCRGRRGLGVLCRIGALGRRRGFGRGRRRSGRRRNSRLLGRGGRCDRLGGVELHEDQVLAASHHESQGLQQHDPHPADRRPIVGLALFDGYA